MHGLAVYVKEGLPFAQDLSLENSLCMVFDSISSNIDEVLLINPCANVFVFGDFNVHHKDWLTYSGGNDRSAELCYNQIVNVPARIPDSDSHSPALLDLFLLTLVFVLRRLSLHWEILIMLLSQFPWTFHHIHNEMTHFIA